MAAVDVIEDTAALSSSTGRPVFVLARPEDRTLIAAAHEAMGIDDQREPFVHRRWRPDVLELSHHVAVTVASVDAEGEALPLELLVNERALLVISDAETAAAARAALLASAPDSPSAAVAAVLVEVARTAGLRLGASSEELTAIDNRGSGFTSGDQRRQIRELRTRALLLRELFDVQATLLAPEEDLHRLLPEEVRPQLRRARAAFDFLGGSAGRVYAVAGDIMSEQNALINERLTLVSTVFLPLTVTTGFFGMNFGWLTDQIGSLPTFVIFGILAPILVTLVTLAVVRRLGAGDAAT